MASRAFHSLFLRARDQLAGSSHWAYLALLALALIHAVVVTPYIADSRLESETSLQRTRLAAVESSLGELRGALEAVRQETSSMVAPALERLTEDLEADLARLEATWRQIAAQATPDAEPGDSDPGATSTAGEPATTSPQALTPSHAQPFLIEDPDRIADLRDARTSNELLAALTPLVDDLITRPRYFDLERGWQDDALPRLEARLDAAASALPRLRSRFPEARDQWEALTGSLTALSSAARDLKFSPPAQPTWWVRSESPLAPDSIKTDEQLLGLTPEIADEIRHPRRLAELETAADRSIESYSEIVGKVAQAKRELGEPEAGVFDWLDLAAVAMFPLLIGLVLGGTMIWRSQRLRELGFTTRLAVEHGGPAGLKTWFWSQVQWNTAAGASASAAWRACVIQTLIGYFLAMGWIALAAVQLRQLDRSDHQRLMIYTISGASIVLLAVAHRLLVARRAIMVLDDAQSLEDSVETVDGETVTDSALEGTPLATETLPEITESERASDPDDEFLGVRPLRR